MWLSLHCCSIVMHSVTVVLKIVQLHFCEFAMHQYVFPVTAVHWFLTVWMTTLCSPAHTFFDWSICRLVTWNQCKICWWLIRRNQAEGNTWHLNSHVNIDISILMAIFKVNLWVSCFFLCLLRKRAFDDKWHKSLWAMCCYGLPTNNVMALKETLKSTDLKPI